MSSLSNLNVSLTPELEKFVEEWLSNGRYATSSDMVREGLRLLQQRERDSDEALRLLKEKLQRASIQADQGQLVDGDTVFAKIDTMINQRREASGAEAK